MVKRRKALIAVLLPLIFIAACSGSNSDNEVGLAAPVIVPIAELADMEVEISTSRPLVITVQDSPEDWVSGSVDDAEIAEFQPGRVEGTASFNPGFKGLIAGSTVAHVVNPLTGEELSFTLIVSP